MNETTAKLLEQLASKLGTTTEYLWSVLLKQASIDATTTLFQFILIGISAKSLYSLHKKLCKEVDGYTGYEKNESYIFTMAIAGIIVAFLAVIAFFHIGDVVNGLVNPEYWALDRILKATE